MELFPDSMPLHRQCLILLLSLTCLPLNSCIAFMTHFRQTSSGKLLLTPFPCSHPWAWVHWVCRITAGLWCWCFKRSTGNEALSSVGRDNVQRDSYRGELTGAWLRSQGSKKSELKGKHENKSCPRNLQKAWGKALKTGEGLSFSLNVWRVFKWIESKHWSVWRPLRLACKAGGAAVFHDKWERRRMSEMLSKQYLPWLNRGCMKRETLEREECWQGFLRKAGENSRGNRIFKCLSKRKP